MCVTVKSSGQISHTPEVIRIEHNIGKNMDVARQKTLQFGKYGSSVTWENNVVLHAFIKNRIADVISI